MHTWKVILCSFNFPNGNLLGKMTHLVLLLKEVRVINRKGVSMLYMYPFPINWIPLLKASYISIKNKV